MNNTTTDIVHLAKKFNRLENTSIYSLLKDTGYFDMHNQISEDTIWETLLLCPECVKDWLNFSEDKRISEGWYFREDGATYEVGYFATDNDKKKSTKYSDPIKACASFIKHEIEEVRNG